MHLQWLPPPPPPPTSGHFLYNASLFLKSSLILLFGITRRGYPGKHFPHIFVLDYLITWLLDYLINYLITFTREEDGPDHFAGPLLHQPSVLAHHSEIKQNSRFHPVWTQAEILEINTYYPLSNNTTFYWMGCVSCGTPYIKCKTRVVYLQWIFSYICCLYYYIYPLSLFFSVSHNRRNQLLSFYSNNMIN